MRGIGAACAALFIIRKWCIRQLVARRGSNPCRNPYPPTCCAWCPPPLPSAPLEGSGGSGTVRHDMAGMIVLLQWE